MAAAVPGGGGQVPPGSCTQTDGLANQIRNILLREGLSEEKADELIPAIVELCGSYPPYTAQEIRALGEKATEEYVENEARYADERAKPDLKRKLREFAIRWFENLIQNALWALVVYLWLRLTGYVAPAEEDQSRCASLREMQQRNSELANRPLSRALRQRLESLLLANEEGLRLSSRIRDNFWEKARQSMLHDPTAQEVAALLNDPVGEEDALDFLFDYLRSRIIDYAKAKLSPDSTYAPP
jgi:hypothetical protein